MAECDDQEGQIPLLLTHMKASVKKKKPEVHDSVFVDAITIKF